MNHTAIYNTHANVVSIDDTEGATDAQGNVVVLDEDLITAEVTRLQAEYDSKQYQRNRAEAYPSLTEQADMAYWDRQNNTTTLDDAISAVKTTYPKPGE
jgi:ABC-type uncharacterized transport system ATPase component